MHGKPEDKRWMEIMEVRMRWIKAMELKWIGRDQMERENNLQFCVEKS